MLVIGYRGRIPPPEQAGKDRGKRNNLQDRKIFDRERRKNRGRPMPGKHETGGKSILFGKDKTFLYAPIKKGLYALSGCYTISCADALDTSKFPWYSRHTT
jgi:hypothetical protein